jgi:undecaprenyl-diphosphatase
VPVPRLRLRQALALGLLQGPTELLPVSSSAHTTLVPWLAGWPYAGLDGELRKSFEVALHAGAGLALAIDMRGELLEGAVGLDRRRATVIALSLAPAVIAGSLLQRPIERRLGGPRSIAAGLIAGAVAMAIADRRPRATGRRQQDAGPLDGLALGLGQAAALIPGVSRSGATLTAARARGFARADAHALSWHAALPVILGAGTLKGLALIRRRGATEELAPKALVAGGAGAFLSTLASARVLRRAPHTDRPLLPYSLYRALLATLVLARLRSLRTANAPSINT